jgi:murein L,D-transpeptidase YafK
MNAANTKYLMESTDDKTLHRFWENIRKGYLWFEQNGTAPEVKINGLGYYELISN